jgi:hypothetical protein
MPKHYIDDYDYINFETESFIFSDEQRSRPLSAEKKIEKREGAREPDDLHPLCCRKPSGTYEDTPAPFAAAGHLIASILSGNNDERNLVPVSKKFNDQMEQIEKDILKVIKEEELVIEPKLEVKVLKYHDEDGRIPESIEYRLKYTQLTRTGNKKTVSGGTKRRPGISKQVDEFDETNVEIPYGPIHQDYLVVRAIDPKFRDRELKEFLDGLKTEMGAAWKVENLNSYKHLVSQKMKEVPPERRPYAVLDYWFLQKNGEGYLNDHYKPYALDYQTNLDIGCEFLDFQKDLIFKIHYANHAGFLKSDVYGMSAGSKPKGVPVPEPYQDLIHGAAGNGPSFDHICPINLDGSNLFSNCQLTSMAFNSRKGRNF